MKYKSEFGAEDKGLIHRIRAYSCLSGCSSFALLVFLHFTQLLVMHPVFSLTCLTTVYLALNMLAFWFGLLRDSEHWQWKINRGAKISKMVWTYCKTLVIAASSVILFIAIPILLGAPLIEHFRQTLHFAVYLTAALTFPSCIMWGCDRNKWTRILLGTGPQTTWESCWMRVISITLAGAWFGAFVIPLDWDRPWQPWPISSSYGSLVAFSAAHLYNFVILQSIRGGKRKFV